MKKETDKQKKDEDTDDNPEVLCDSEELPEEMEFDDEGELIEHGKV
jgi:hypothetical protein